MSSPFGQLALVMAAVVSLAAAGESTIHSFDDAPEGMLPHGWLAAKTGAGEGSVWKIVAYDLGGKRQHALAQTSSAGPNALFNLCVVDGPKYGDVDLAARLKAISGNNDQGGGLVWRYRDANNYYVTRWNPLEDNFRVYHVVNGKRTQLATADVKAAKGEWHTVRAVQRGNRIQCYLDDKLFLDVTDETLQGAGLVGLWSKSDAVTWFDDVTIKTPAKE
jgi:hypothetical protein